MKAKISKRMVLPMLYGILAGWIVTGALAVLLLTRYSATPLLTALVSVSGVLLLALFPMLRRGASVYSSALRYHTAEYLYDLGNGVEAALAVETYEKKAKRAVVAWIRRKLLRSSFATLPVTFLALLMGGLSVGKSLSLVVFLLLMVLLSAVIGLFVMLYAARRYCYDKYGNIKKN